MGRRFAIVIGAATLGAALIAAGASADFRSVADPRGDTKCQRPGPRGCSDRTRDADIVRATAGHGKNGWLKHTTRVVGKFKTASLEINTDSDRACEWFLPVVRGIRSPGVHGCTSEEGDPRARYDFHRHAVEIFFSKRSIGNPQSYGWRVGTWAGDNEYGAKDRVPNDHGRYIPHRLGDSGVAAAGVMALGAQTASAGVHKYDTKLTIARDRSSFFHGHVKSEVRKCERGRRWILFKKRPGADRKLAAGRSAYSGGSDAGWGVVLPRGTLHRGDRHYAVVRRKVRPHFVCRANRSKTLTWPQEVG